MGALGKVGGVFGLALGGRGGFSAESTNNDLKNNFRFSAFGGST